MWHCFGLKKERSRDCKTIGSLSYCSARYSTGHCAKFCGAQCNYALISLAHRTWVFYNREIVQHMKLDKQVDLFFKTKQNSIKLDIKIPRLELSYQNYVPSTCNKKNVFRWLDFSLAPYPRGWTLWDMMIVSMPSPGCKRFSAVL